MVTLEALEKTVAQLSSEELAAFRRWFAEFDDRAWTAQMESDAAAGKMDDLAEEALGEYHSGQATEI